MGIGAYFRLARAGFILARVLVGEFGGAAGTLSSLGSEGLKCQAELMKELKPGTRIVSHAFDMGDWKPDVQFTMDAKDKYGGAGGGRGESRHACRAAGNTGQG